MNKQKFVELINAPDQMSGNDFADLEKVVQENPYFQIAHAILAKASKTHKKSEAKQIVNRAALYATNRNVFKHFITGQPVNTDQKTASSPTSTPSSSTPSSTEAFKSDDHLDKLRQEVFENLEQWKNNRESYLKFDESHPEEIVIDPSTPTDVTSTQEFEVEKLKNQVAEEVEEEEIQAAVDKVERKISLQSTEEPEAEEKQTPSEPEPEVSEKNILEQELAKAEEQLNEFAQREEEIDSESIVSESITEDKTEFISTSDENKEDENKEDEISVTDVPELSVQDLEESSAALANETKLATETPVDIDDTTQEKEEVRQAAEEASKIKEDDTKAFEEVSTESDSDGPIVESIEGLDIDLSLITEEENEASEEDEETEEIINETETPSTKVVEELPIPSPDDELISAELLSAIVDATEESLKDGEDTDEEKEISIETESNVVAETAAAKNIEEVPLKNEGSVSPELSNQEVVTEEEDSTTKTDDLSEDTPSEPEIQNDNIEEEQDTAVEEETIESEVDVDVLEDKQEKAPEQEDVAEEDLSKEVDKSSEENIELAIDIDNSGTTSENEEELDRLDNEKQELKLDLNKGGGSKPKKFRLSVMKRPINFTKSKKVEKEKKKEKPTPKDKDIKSKEPEKKEEPVKKATPRKKTPAKKSTKSTATKKATTKKAAPKAATKKASSPKSKGDDEKKKSGQ